MPNYKEIERVLLPNYTPFTHAHSMSAVWSGDEYLVYSYRTLIASRNSATGETWIDPTKYSVTTSKQQNLIRRAWGVK